MSNRTALQSAILDFVAGAEAAGRVIDVNAAVIELSSRYPQSGMTIEEICRSIEQAAVEAHGTILTGARPSDSHAA